MRSRSHSDYGFPGSKLRSRLSMTSWMLLSCLCLFVLRMLRSWRDSLTLAVIFMSLPAVSQRSIHVWVGPGESQIHWIMGRGAVTTCVGGRKSEFSGPWCFQSCFTDVRRTLTRDLRRRLNSFGSRSLRRILGYRWSDFVSNERLLRETQMRFVTCMVREHQLRLYGHVACFPDADPAHQILSARESRERWRPMGRPHASWLQQVDRHLKEIGMGRASAWGITRRRLLEYRRKVDAATRCSGACSHT